MRGTRARQVYLLLLGVLLALFGCACGGFRPYRAMAKAGTSEESVFSQVSDDRLRMQVREALLAEGSGLSISPHVYMGHVYLTGYVDSAEQRQRMLSLASGVSGVRSVDGYLPDKSTDSGSAVSNKASDVEIQGKLKAEFAASGDEVVTRIDTEVLDGHVVLMGVVSSEQAIQSAVSSAQNTAGVTGVTNFLLLPEAGYERMRPGLR